MSAKATTKTQIVLDPKRQWHCPYPKPDISGDPAPPPPRLPPCVDERMEGNRILQELISNAVQIWMGKGKDQHCKFATFKNLPRADSLCFYAVNCGWGGRIWTNRRRKNPSNATRGVRNRSSRPSSPPVMGPCCISFESRCYA